MQNKTRLLSWALILTGGVVLVLNAQRKPHASSRTDDPILQNAARMLEEGRTTFRSDTFGSEAFWGDALQLHKAIAGEKLGGVDRG